MKNIIVRQIVFIPILYISSKLLWDSLPVEILPEILKGVVTDIFGPPFVMVFVLLSFICFLWRVPIIGKLSQFLFGTKLYIRGTWKGRLKYEWDGKKTEKTVFLAISQPDGYSLNIRLLTDERISKSIFADIILDNSEQKIVYTYKNEESPNNKEKNPSHEGFCQLDIINASNFLQGIYYTSRKTFGELIFDKRHRRVVFNFKKAEKLFKK